MAYTLDDLLYLMRRLRDPETGCPWDVQQTLTSIVPYTIEETYEAAEALESQDWPHAEEELGDVLLQIALYGQIASEDGLFSTESIIDKLVAKLIRRHPHVFPDGSLQSVRDPALELTDAKLKELWQAVKAQERASQPQPRPQRLLDAVPSGFPAFMRALKLQKAAAKVGFDWPDTAGVVAKVDEELEELKAELLSGDKTRQAEELGDLLFSLVNLARHLDIDPETALRGTNQRFTTRFNAVEEQIEQQGGWQQADLDSMEAAWQQAKTFLR